MTAAQIIDAVIAQCGTDASRATVLSLLNEQYASQVADSRWMRTVASIGDTVLEQSQYPIPVGLIEAFGVKVGDAPYTPVGDDSLWQVRAGTATLSYGRGGVYSQTYDSAGALVIDLQPSPTVAGVPITVYGAVLPAPLTDGTNAPVTPVDTHGSLIDGTAALVMLRIDERPDLSAPFQARFQARTEDLRRRKNTMLRGSGPLQMAVQGRHF